MTHSPLHVLQCSESRYVFSRNHRFGVRKKTKHSATLCLWPCNSPTPGLNCAGAGRLWSSSDVQSFKTQIFQPTTNSTEKAQPKMTKTLSKIKRNPPTMWRRCWIISNGWKYIGLTWTLTAVRVLRHASNLSWKSIVWVCQCVFLWIFVVPIIVASDPISMRRYVWTCVRMRAGTYKSSCLRKKT